MIRFFTLLKATIYLLPLLFILSCGKDESCGVESRSEIYFENSIEFSEIHRYTTEDANFFSNYYYRSDSISQDSIIIWTVQMELRNICVSDKPIIDFLIALDNPDSSIVVIGGVVEDLNNYQFEPITDPQQGIYYRSTINYSLKGNYDESATIKVPLSIQHKSKGSFTADKTYLFSNFDVGAIRVIYHNPE